MSAKNKKLLAVLGSAAAVLLIVGISVSMLGKGSKTPVDDPASVPPDVSVEDTGKQPEVEPSSEVPDVSVPESTPSQPQEDAVLDVEQEDQVEVDLTESQPKPEQTPPPAPSQEEQQAASEKNEPIVNEPDSSQPQTGDTQNGSIYLEGFGWITDEGGGSVQHNIDSDGDINKQVGNMG